MVSAPVKGQSLCPFLPLSPSIFFSLLHFPSNLPHLGCLSLSKPYPSVTQGQFSTHLFLKLPDSPPFPPPGNTVFASLSFFRICLALRDRTLTLKEAQVWLLSQPHSASSHVYMLPPQRDKAMLSSDPGSRRGRSGSASCLYNGGIPRLNETLYP